MKNSYVSEYGTVLQAFGRYFVGATDMMMKRKYKLVQDNAEEPFKIVDISPFSICSEPIKRPKKYTKADNITPREKADKYKNFSAICESCYADWFIMDNSAATMALREENGRYYTVLEEEEATFTDLIYPVDEGFSERLKKQYDMLIDIVLEHYNCDRIILVTSHVSRFYCENSENGEIRLTEYSDSVPKIRKLLSELDEYFIGRTGCYVLRTSERYWQQSAEANGFGFTDDFRVAIEDDIAELIENPDKKTSLHQMPNTRNRYKTDGWLYFEDYVAEGGSDLSFAQKYFKNADYSFGDIVALFYLYDKMSGNELFGSIAKVILSNRNGVAYMATKELFEKNLKWLSGYEYCLIDTKDAAFDGSIVVPLAFRRFLRINASGELSTFNTLHNGEWNHETLVKNSYNCHINELEDALSSWALYFERGRRKCLDPFVLRFDSEKEFMESLQYLNYEEILSNENYVLALWRQEFELQKYMPKVDASFWFEKKSRVAYIDNGLSDQMRTYFSAKNISECYKLNLYFEDLHYDSYNRFTALPIHYVVKKNIKTHFFSNIFSEKLRLEMKRKQIRRDSGWEFINFNAQNYFEFGLNELQLIICCATYKNSSLERLLMRAPSCSSIFVRTIRDYLRYISLVDHGAVLFKCYSYSESPVLTKLYHDRKHELNKLYRRLFSFPPISKKDTLNYKTAALLQSTNSIAIHLRRGDYITDGNAVPDVYFYKNALEVICFSEQFSYYKNKKLFVISDDIQYCREHKEEIGLDLFGDDVLFVDWNHHFDSFRDMHLISLAKIVVRSIGGFAHSGTLISTTNEYVILTLPTSIDRSVPYTLPTGISIERQPEDAINANNSFTKKKIRIRSLFTGNYVGDIYEVSEENEDRWCKIKSVSTDKYLSAQTVQGGVPVCMVDEASDEDSEQFKIYKFENGYAIQPRECKNYLHVKEDELYVNESFCIRKDGLFDIEVI